MYINPFLAAGIYLLFVTPFAITTVLVVIVYRRLGSSQSELARVSYALTRLRGENSRQDESVKLVVALMKTIDEDPAALARLAELPSRIVIAAFVAVSKIRYRALEDAEKNLARAIKENPRGCTSTVSPASESRIAELQEVAGKARDNLLEADEALRAYMQTYPV